MSLVDYTLQKCNICNASKVKAKPLLNDTEALLFLESVYNGDYDVNHLPTTFYLKNARMLEESLATGFGEVKTEAQSDKMLKMRRNVYFFSAAKTYTLVNELSKKKKEVDSFNKYKNDFSYIVGDFVGAYNEAENNQAEYCGKAGKKWSRFEEKNIEPYLEYVTMKDNRVRPAHVYLDGIIRQRDDNFWSTFMPPNGWNCRCKVKSYNKGENTSLKDFDKEEALANVPVMFRMNFGKEGIVFPHDHPYFKKADRQLAKRNFNLPLPYASK